MSPVQTLGHWLVSFTRYLGDLSLLAAETIRGIFHGQVRMRLVVQQIYEVGYRSQLVVLITGAFTGAVFATQTFFQFHRLQMDTAVGPVVSVSMFRELGPVLCGLMVAGRVGAAMSAELGTMKVTEQLDALRALGVARAALRRVVIEQSFWVGVVGLGLAGALTALLAVIGHFAHVDMRYPWWMLLPLALTMLVVAVLSGLLALRPLNRVDPANLLR